MAHESFEDAEVAAAANAELRVHQGRPGGTPRPRCRVHERDRRADRAGRLADDVLPDARRPTVLLRHLLPESAIPATAFGGRAKPGGTAAARWSRPPIRSPVNCARWRPDCPAAARRSRRRTVRPRGRRRAAATRTPCAAGSAAHRSSRRLHCWRRCCAPTSAPGRPMCWPPSSAPVRRWPAVASTISWPAASPATASTMPGWYRISRRCCTTTRCCCGCTRTGRGAPDRAGAPRRGGDRRLPVQRPGRRRSVHLVAGRRRRRPRGLDLRVDAGATARCARRRRRALGSNFSPLPTAGTFEHGASVLQLPVDADDDGRLDRVRAALLAARAAASSRPATPRSSPSGTGWRSPRWPRRRWHWTGPNCSMPQ